MRLARMWFAFALWLAMCLMVLSPSVSADQKENGEAALGKMAEEYWTKRLIEHDYKFTYERELDKESMPFSEYLDIIKRGENFKFLSVTTKHVEIDGDRGIVYLTQECHAPFHPKAFKTTLQDLWLFRSGQWKHKFTHN